MVIFKCYLSGEHIALSLKTNNGVNIFFLQISATTSHLVEFCFRQFFDIRTFPVNNHRVAVILEAYTTKVSYMYVRTNDFYNQTTNPKNCGCMIKPMKCTSGLEH